MDTVSPDEEIFNGEVDSVTLSGTLGSFTILPKHTPIVSLLKVGVLPYVTKGGEERVQDIHGGLVETNNNKTSVCVD